jgi:hypothetical protein
VPLSVSRAQWALGTAGVTSIVVLIALAAVSLVLYSKQAFITMPVPFFLHGFMGGAPFGLAYRIKTGKLEQTRMAAMSLAALVSSFRPSTLYAACLRCIG